MDEDNTTTQKTLSVTELTRAVKSLLEGSIGEVLVEGEISNWRVAGSGHAYFVLKDAGAAVNCVMFRSQMRAISFKPEDGTQVELSGRLSVYEPRGQYQIIVETMKESGLGDLYRAFLELKAKLEKEGLFKEEFKKPIPYLPRRIGVVTSSTGAAIRDILNIIGRRFANVEVCLYPVRVQGKEAPGEIAHAINRMNELALVDVLIVGRGGGSIEDLWAFNEEVVARAIFNSSIPVISAVGHETDFTIADFVADLRAPTPSAAAELVIRDREELLQRTVSLMKRLRGALRNRLALLRENVMRLAGSYVLRRVPDKLIRSQQRLDELLFRLQSAVSVVTKDAGQRLTLLSEKMHTLNPGNVLARGYSIVCRRETKEVIKDAGTVVSGDQLDIRLSKGALESEVTNTYPEK